MDKLNSLLILIMILTNDPERPWTIDLPLLKSIYHSNVYNMVVRDYNNYRKKLAIIKYHILKSCHSVHNKLSKKSTEIIVSNFLVKAKKCIMRFVILTSVLYVLLKLMTVIPITLPVIIIQGFTLIMNVLYGNSRVAYMYKVDHDEVNDMVFCKSRQSLMLNFIIKINDFFTQKWFLGMYGDYEKILSKNFDNFYKNEDFFTHNKRPCLMQFLTAETTWCLAVSRSKGQEEVTPNQICQHPVRIAFFETQELCKGKKWNFEAKIGHDKTKDLVLLKKKVTGDMEP